MDEKQFDLFQRTLQFAVDEHRTNGVSGAFDMANWLVVDKDAPIKFKKTKAVLKGAEEDGKQTWFVSNEIAVGACGTAACLAGTAALLHGGVQFAADVLRTSFGKVERDEDVEYVVCEDGEVEDIDHFARRAMGMTPDEAGRLFYMPGETDHDMAQLVKVATKIAAKHGHKLEII